jgi:hypothetical protein
MNIIKLLKRKVLSYQKLVAKYKAPETFFIYQMGKVGSTTLEHSLPNAIHIHAFYSKNHTCAIRMHGLAKFGLRYFYHRAEQELTQFLLRRAFKQRENTKIITLVRDPLARNISMYFHDLDAYLFAAHTNCLNTRARALATRCQQTDILKEVFEQEFDHQYPLRWFDQELLAMTGINVYDHAFDKESGFTQISNQGSNIELMVVRTDQLTKSVDALSDFIQQPIELLTSNQAEDKWYGELYQSFKNSYIVPENLKTELDNSQLYRHFFK